MLEEVTDAITLLLARCNHCKSRSNTENKHLISKGKFGLKMELIQSFPAAKCVNCLNGYEVDVGDQISCFSKEFAVPQCDLTCGQWFSLWFSPVVNGPHLSGRWFA